MKVYRVLTQEPFLGDDDLYRILVHTDLSYVTGLPEVVTSDDEDDLYAIIRYFKGPHLEVLEIGD